MIRPNTIPQAFFTAFLAVFLLFLTPALIQRFYLPAAPAFVWLINAIPRAIGALYIIAAHWLLCSLLKDAYKWFSRRRARSTSLDDTAASGEDVPHADTAFSPSALGNIILAKILLSGSLALWSALIALTGDIVSLEHPLPDSLGAWVLFFFDALQVFLGVFAVLAVTVLKYRLDDRAVVQAPSQTVDENIAHGTAAKREEEYGRDDEADLGKA
ncbi:hypothetical protein B0H19DRAFT_1065728 [Mycena capillaripes]|nr:hypothetical protein B0H19DRAFT_1065728 [Mycena capillaripes]